VKSRNLHSNKAKKGNSKAKSAGRSTCTSDLLFPATAAFVFVREYSRQKDSKGRRRKQPSHNWDECNLKPPMKR